ncbi:hypothetical protein MASR1M32_33480 [Rhodobacter sp.]
MPGLVLEGRLHAPVLEHSPEADLWAATRADYAALADQGRWSELSPGCASPITTARRRPAGGVWPA